MKRRKRGRALRKRYGKSRMPLDVLEHKARRLIKLVRSRGGRV
jgi:hypothetical protein